MSEPNSDATIERERLEFDKSKAERDFSFRERELRGFWKDLVKGVLKQLPILASIFITLLVAQSANDNSLKIARESAAHEETRSLEQIQSTMTLAHQKAQTDFLIQAISTGNPKTAKENILFFIKAGIIEDREHKIENTIKSSNTAPSLPSVFSGTSVPVTGWMTKLVLDTNTGLGVAHAKISCGNFETTSTDADGKFFCNLPTHERSVLIGVDARGYKSFHQPVSIDSDEPLKLTPEIAH
jgi:hypothetical protein